MWYKPTCPFSCEIVVQWRQRLGISWGFDFSVVHKDHNTHKLVLQMWRSWWSPMYFYTRSYDTRIFVRIPRLEWRHELFRGIALLPGTERGIMEDMTNPVCDFRFEPVCVQSTGEFSMLSRPHGKKIAFSLNTWQVSQRTVMIHARNARNDEKWRWHDRF